jgi:prolyl-tRNA editing enzyme YbaK/EbsC (Cys-tRNA(Pro) deacylase)
MPDEAEARVREALGVLGLPYELFPCDPALADTALFCAHYGYPLDKSANTIVVKAKTGPKGHSACVVLATTRLDVNHTVRKRLGARRVSFASAEETRELTGMDLGGVTPIALPPELPLWVDSRVMATDYVILGAGSRAAKVKISPEVFRRTPNTSVVEGLARGTDGA